MHRNLNITSDSVLVKVVEEARRENDVEYIILLSITFVFVVTGADAEDDFL